MGVKRAVDIVLDIAQHRNREKIYTYGPLIHNPQTIEILEKRGVFPLDDIDEVEEGTIVIRAHGISPKDREQISKKGMRIVDATCPKVARVQSIIRKHSKLGYTIIIAGNNAHPEVIGLMGYASGRGIVVSGPDEVADLPPLDKVCLVTQTTQNADVYDAIVKRTKERFPGAVVFNTICNSTERRQAEIRELATKMDAIIIVGGRNSANTQQLAAISRDYGTPTYHIEMADELKTFDLSGFENIGVSAGASTPNWITDGVIDYLSHYHEKRGPRGLRYLYNLWIFLVRTDLYSAIGAGCLTGASMFLQELKVSILNILIAAFYVYAVHTINRLKDRNVGRIMGSFREELYIRHKKTYYFLALCCLFVAIGLSFAAGTAPFAILLMLALFGVLYNIRLFPASWGFRRPADIPASKSIFVALAWATITVLVPRFTLELSISAGMVVAFLFVFTLVFAKSSLSDMVDIQSDRLVGEETIPVVIGEQKTRILLTVITALMGLILLGGVSLGYTGTAGLALLISIFYIWICLRLCDKKARFSSIVLEGLLGTNYIVTGLSIALWSLLLQGVPGKW